MHCLDPLIFSSSIKSFWHTRKRQADLQRKRGQTDQGSRSAVTGGRQMDGFSETISRLLIDAEIDENDIFQRVSVELPGYFRPTKEWDIVVVVDGNLIAAIELKSQVGPSFGNNFNNRTEEALGPPWISGPPIARVLSVHLLLLGWAICCFWRIARNRGVRLGSESLIFLFFLSFTMPLIQSVMNCSAESWSGRDSITLPALSLQIARAQTPLRIIRSLQRISQQLNLSLNF